MQAFLLVGAGGALGAMGRHGMGVIISRLGFSGFPHATMIVNILGSLLMGLFIGILARTTPQHQAELRLFVAVGILGGFTTFSSFSLDTISLLERGQISAALFYILGSVVVGVLALYLGLVLMRGAA